MKTIILTHKEEAELLAAHNARLEEKNVQPPAACPICASPNIEILSSAVDEAGIGLREWGCKECGVAWHCQIWITYHPGPSN